MLLHQLSTAQVLRDVSDASLERLARAGETLEAPADYRIIEEGEVPFGLVLLMRGRLEVFVPDPANRLQGQRLALLKPGECCGEYGFIDRRPASASVKAVEASTLFTLRNEDLDALLRRDRAAERLIYRNLLTALVGRLRASNVVIDRLRSPVD